MLKKEKFHQDMQLPITAIKKKLDSKQHIQPVTKPMKCFSHLPKSLLEAKPKYLLKYIY